MATSPPAPLHLWAFYYQGAMLQHSVVLACCSLDASLYTHAPLAGQEQPKDNSLPCH